MASKKCPQGEAVGSGTSLCPRGPNDKVEGRVRS